MTPYFQGFPRHILFKFSLKKSATNMQDIKI